MAHPTLTPLASLTAASLAVLTALGCGGPVGPFSGGALRGPVVAALAGALLCDAETVALETNPADPYSVHTWCLGTGDAIYIPTSLILGPSDPAERQWVRNVAADPQVRLRIDDNVLELRAERVLDPDELEDARTRLLARYETEPDPEGHASAAWIFKLLPR